MEITRYKKMGVFKKFINFIEYTKMSDIINIFFHMDLNIKLFHWQTKSFAKHKASDSLHGDLMSLIDKFVEVYIGKYGDVDMSPFTVSVESHTDKDISKCLKRYIYFLQEELPTILKESDTDLLSLRDDMLIALNQTLYLFKLN